jgi:hypothetical protein
MGTSYRFCARHPRPSIGPLIQMDRSTRQGASGELEVGSRHRDAERFCQWGRGTARPSCSPKMRRRPRFGIPERRCRERRPCHRPTPLTAWQRPHLTARHRPLLEPRDRSHHGVVPNPFCCHRGAVTSEDLAARGARETTKAIKPRLRCTRCGGCYADLQPDWSQCSARS